jgi:hypothetical protein
LCSRLAPVGEFKEENEVQEQGAVVGGGDDFPLLLTLVDFYWEHGG